MEDAGVAAAVEEGVEGVDRVAVDDGGDDEDEDDEDDDNDVCIAEEPWRIPVEEGGNEQNTGEREKMFPNERVQSEQSTNTQMITTTTYLRVRRRIKMLG